ncbi:MAG: lysophospholipid acyltransferase family protein, partial [Anaerovoracaceae bacterium]
INAYSSLPELGQYKQAIEKERAEGDYKSEQEYLLKAMSSWGKMILSKVGVTYTVHHKENLPKVGPVVYVCNHQGYADIPVLCAALDQVQFGFIARAGLEKVPFYGAWIDRVRSILIEREDPRSSLKTIGTGITYLQRGFSLLIFPEGTRSQGGPMKEFKKGALKLATKPGVPIVPLTINGTAKIFEETGAITKAHVEIVVHQPISTDKLSRQEEKELSGKIFSIIQGGLN